MEYFAPMKVFRVGKCDRSNLSCWSSNSTQGVGSNSIQETVARSTGSFFFEGSVAGYWLNLISTGILYAGVSLGLMKWRKIEQKDWLQGAICIALPGMLGEIPILVGFSELMSNMQPATAGRYAAFLFGGYSTLIGAAWFMSARVSSQVTSATGLYSNQRVD